MTFFVYLCFFARDFPISFFAPFALFAANDPLLPAEGAMNRAPTLCTMRSLRLNDPRLPSEGAMNRAPTL